MRNFFLGLSVGLILATGLTAFAQLVPFDAPLKSQLQGVQSQQWLSRERAMERMEQGLYSDPLLAMPGGPCQR